MVTDLDDKTATAVQQSLLEAREQAGGLQFISVQTSPEEKRFAGFWMLRDLPQP
ncbi:MAG: Tab2 family RNA-binding protein [Cyanobacteriota bacterium]|nr:Tab2 family RNA-binding protein [Cyanobacteriota bacterium]